MNGSTICLHLVLLLSLPGLSAGLFLYICILRLALVVIPGCNFVCGCLNWDVSVQSVEVEAKQFGLGLADILFPPDDGMTFKIAHAVQVMESVSSKLHIAIGKFADHIYNRSVSFFYLWHLVVTRNKHA